MKTALVTLGLAVVFFGAGLGITRMMRPHDAAETEAAGDHADDADAAHASGGETLGELQGDVQQVAQRLAAAESRADSLRRLLDEHEATYQESQADAAAMASTLSRLEDPELKAIVQRLDGRSFVKLYEAASSRNQSRLLDALTPDQAASFIRHQLPGGVSGEMPRPAAERAAPTRPASPARPATSRPAAPRAASPTVPAAQPAAAPARPAQPETRPSTPSARPTAPSARPATPTARPSADDSHPDS